MEKYYACINCREKEVIFHPPGVEEFIQFCFNFQKKKKKQKENFCFCFPFLCCSNSVVDESLLERSITGRVRSSAHPSAIKRSSKDHHNRSTEAAETVEFHLIHARASILESNHPST